MSERLMSRAEVESVTYRLAAEKLYKALVYALAEVETLRAENAALRWQVRQDHCPFCFGSCACDGEGN